MANIIAFLIVSTLFIAWVAITKLSKIHHNVKIVPRETTKKQIKKVCIHVLCLVGLVGVVIAAWLVLFL